MEFFASCHSLSFLLMVSSESYCYVESLNEIRLEHRREEVKICPIDIVSSLESTLHLRLSFLLCYFHSPFPLSLSLSFSLSPIQILLAQLEYRSGFQENSWKFSHVPYCAASVLTENFSSVEIISCDWSRFHHPWTFIVSLFSFVYFF